MKLPDPSPGAGRRGPRGAVGFHSPPHGAPLFFARAGRCNSAALSQATYPGPVSTATVVIPVGLGLQWNLDSRSRLFVQASYDILFKHLSVQSVPLVGGFEVHF